jgi:hypothetical protein
MFRDHHDRLTDKICDQLDDPVYFERMLDRKDHLKSPIIANLNLVGLRRRLNSLERAAWVIVALLAVHVWRHW